MTRTLSTATATSYLSKTDFVHGLRCSKLVWHSRNAGHLIPALDQQTLAVLDEGKRVGQLARQLFPGGVEILGRDFDEAVAITDQMLHRRCPLYEPAFVFNGCCARADVLVPAGDDSWDLVETKSTTRMEEIHLHDLAFQAYVLAGAGLKIRRCIIAHINSSFVKHGSIDARQFFVLEDVTSEVSTLNQGVEDKVDEMLRAIRLAQAPAVPIGKHCDDPRCPLLDTCWSYLPKANVTELYRAGAKRFQLLARGITAIADIPDNFKLTKNQNVQRQAVKSQRAHVDGPAIQTFLQQIKFPASFVDFESYAPAVPWHDRARPYQQIVFQYSLHVLRSPDAEPEHFAFLAEGTGDPRPEFMRRLREVLPTEGSIIAFNAVFELARLKECAELMPEFQPWVEGIKRRMADLLLPFRGFRYYHPEQHGSASMKVVLPVLTGHSYDRLAIQAGDTASREYLRVTFGDVSAAERKRVRRELETYCGQDTAGMIWIAEALQKLVSV